MFRAKILQPLFEKSKTNFFRPEKQRKMLKQDLTPSSVKNTTTIMDSMTTRFGT